MNSLVADYGTSSSQSESENSDVEEPPSQDIQTEELPKLPKPMFAACSSINSVFSNPFVEAENAKKALLEKHVKMVPTQDKVQMINGRKICWNYRKGRCRFGHKCTFAHDTDLHKSKELLEEENQIQSTVICEKVAGQSAPPPGGIPQEGEVAGEPQDDWEDRKKLKKRRPGLSQGIVPSKKVMKIYKQQKAHSH